MQHWCIEMPAASHSAATDYVHLRRSLVRKYVAKKPTVRERAALDHAARCMIRAYHASADFSTTPDMLAKLNAAARHALEHLKQIAAERPRPSRNGDDIVRMLGVNEVRP
jgi:hypothetical protein